MAVLCTGAAVAMQQTPPQPAPPTFRAGVDRVTVDVLAVDEAGRPVKDLTAADFDLRVDGKPRPIVSAEFVSYETPAAEATEAPRATHYGSNETVRSSGRPILLVFDQANIKLGDARAASNNASRFLNDIPAGTRVGFVAIPPPGPNVEFTTDREPIRKALSQTIGRGQIIPLSLNIGLTEAMDIERGDLMTFNTVVARECRADDPTCKDAVRMEAGMRIMTSRSDSRASVDSLRGLMAALRKVEGPKAVVLLSQGLVPDRDRSDDLWLGPAAAAAQVTFYIIQLEPAMFDASVGRPSPTAFQDQRMLLDTLELMGDAGGGATFRVIGSADFAFKRIATELTAAYLLSFEPVEAERNGRPHRIEVKVNRPKVLVRARREFNISTAAPAAADGEAAVADLLGSPTIAQGIPLRATAYTLKQPANGMARLVISAEIDRDVTATQEMQVGCMVRDAQGRVGGSSFERASLKPQHEGKPGPLHYVRMLEVKPGRYTLKCGVIDAKGRRGSVEHSVVAQLLAAAPLEASDLMLLGPAAAAAGRLTPPVELTVDEGRFVSVVELYAADRRALEQASIVFSVGESATSPSLVTMKGTLGDIEQTKRLAQGSLSAALLPPGRYVARAVIALGGREVGRVSRPFELTGRPMAGIAPAGGRAATAAALDMGVPPFRKEDALAPPVVTRFIERFSAGDEAVTSAPVQSALDAARRGSFEPPPLDNKAPQADRLAAMFLRGLTRLSNDQLNDAANDFRAALKISSDFFPAIFYLGAAYAAGGRDKEAVGAWQTSLIGEGDTQVIYVSLADALLRLGNLEQAQAILDEASETWPDDPALLTRMGRVRALRGDRAAALEALDRALAKTPDALDTLLLAARIVYEAHLGRGTVVSGPADVARMKTYTAAYLAANGPQKELVAQWLKYVERSR